MLEEYNDVFADILNVALFDGRQVVRREELSDAGIKSQLKIDGRLHEQERDVAKYWRNGEVRIALCGFENQSQPDQDMPLRVFSYDGATYKEQVNKRIASRRAKEKPAPVYPSITIVLYFGEDKWTAPTTLRECITVDLPPELDVLVPDYKIFVFEVARMEPERVKLFQSDFRIVADYLVQKRISKDYIPSDEELVHADGTLKLLSAITADDRFVEEMQTLLSEGKEKMSMCDILDRVEARGEARGIAQGEARGEARGIAQGEARGEARGITQGMFLGMAGLVHDQIIPLKEGARRANMPEKEFEEKMARLYSEPRQ